MEKVSLHLTPAVSLRTLCVIPSTYCWCVSSFLSCQRLLDVNGHAKVGLSEGAKH